MNLNKKKTNSLVCVYLLIQIYSSNMVTLADFIRFQCSQLLVSNSIAVLF